MSNYEYLLVLIPNNLRISLVISLNFSNFAVLFEKQPILSVYYANINHYGAHGTRPTLLSLHPTTFSMAEA